MAFLLVAASMVAVSTPAAAAPPPTPPQPGTRSAPPAGIRPASNTVKPKPPPLTKRPKLTFKTTSSQSALTDDDEPTVCYPWAGLDSSGVAGYDDYLEEVGYIGYSGGIDCDGSLDAISGTVALVDWSPPFNGQIFNYTLAYSTLFDLYSSSSYTSGAFYVYAHDYDGARTVEPVIDLVLQAPGGRIWEPCGFVFGMIVNYCFGVGTETLSVGLSAGYWNTGLTAACRFQNVTGDAEQRRLNQTSGAASTTASIIREFTSIYNRVLTFKRDLCASSAAVTNPDAFVTDRGEQLFSAAVLAARRTDVPIAIRYDDRPLYWARLSMTLAVAQWRPGTNPNLTSLQLKLDRASRGITRNRFTQSTFKRVLATGFDPFDLPGGLTAGNPSAAAVLGLDGTQVNGAEVQVVIFPVRYADFDQLIVEDVVDAHLNSGPQQATLITTVSQGRFRQSPPPPIGIFDLEYWNGRNRSAGGFADNLGQTTSGTPSNPLEPQYRSYATTPQFTNSTLPIGSMTAAGAYPVCTHVTMTEVETRGGPTTTQAPNDTGLECDLSNIPQPHSGWIASAGSGGGFLSNEIAYRATLRRDQLNAPTLPVGHIHTPPMGVPPTGSERENIVVQYRAILSNAIGSTPGSPGGDDGGPGDGQLFCGEASCTPVEDAYISHFTGANCTGTESYYTPYFGSDGIRRSWDGRGLAGTALHPMTNRSWRGTDGQCHTDWPSGNPLNNFVTIYRCGEPTCTPVQAAYISHFTDLGCTGTESYYTPYFGSDGIRRSWDGRGVAGTVLHPMTNRSWRGSNGQCHDDWPDGNPLTNFVTIYR